MTLRPPISTRTHTPFPYTTLSRSDGRDSPHGRNQPIATRARGDPPLLLKKADPMALADPQRIEALDPLDPLALEAELSDEERMVRDTASSYATDDLMPRVTSAFLDERFDREIMREMGSLGLLGATIEPEYR